MGPETSGTVDRAQSSPGFQTFKVWSWFVWVSAKKKEEKSKEGNRKRKVVLAQGDEGRLRFGGRTKCEAIYKYRE